MESGIDRLLIGDIEIASGLIVEMLYGEFRLMRDGLAIEVERCIQARVLRAASNESLVYCISAGSGYEPLTAGPYYRNPPPLDVANLLQQIFEPLVTAKGKRQLSAYFAGTRAR